MNKLKTGHLLAGLWQLDVEGKIDETRLFGESPLETNPSAPQAGVPYTNTPST